MVKQKVAPVQVLFFRGVIYIILVGLLSVFHDLFFAGEAGSGVSRVFAVVLCVTSLQFFFSFQRVSSEQLLSLFLADAATAMLLVRETGGSASPFTLLFPIISLCGAVLFERKTYSYVLLVATVGLMSFAIGMRPAILGNALAVLGTTLLGQYLTAKLKTTDQALEVSEGARRRLENIQKAILANIPSGLMSVDTFGRIIQVNVVGASILESSETRLIGQFLKDLLPEIDSWRDRLHTMYPVVGDLQERSARKIIEYRTSSGKLLKLGYSLARLSDPEDRSPLGTLVVFQDLTHIIKIEEELRLSEKLAAVGKLAAGIAHEIRNPLAGIFGSAQMLEGSSHLDDEDKQLLRIIQRESQRLDGLITEFLNYVRPAPLQVEAVDLKQLVQDVLQSLRVNPLFRDGGCQLRFVELSDKEAWVLADRNKLIQVLINLAINSAQASATEVTFQLRSQGLDVWDDGTGIPLENLSRVFEPFFTTKDRGTGLGLALSYKLIEGMGGSVKVQSPVPDLVERGGSLFTIELRGAQVGHESAAV